ncbi:MAG: glycine--tRNA ligase subunit beta [Candidatus Puniceispirillaceae bacterium]
MASLFFAIGCEEIPARMQAGAGRDLEHFLMSALKDAGLEPEGAKVFYGPRHLALSVDSILTNQPDRDIEKRGPRIDAPDKAIDGFCQSVGMTRDELVQEETDKGSFFFARKTEKGAEAKAILPDMITNILAQFPWPKSQRWGTSRKTWVRPMHQISVLLDHQIIPGAFDLGGDMVIDFANHAQGHRFHANEMFSFDNCADWQAKMRDHFVIVDAQEKTKQITEEIAAKTKAYDIEVIDDDGLLAEVTGLVEWPNVIIGEIADEFMALPEEVLITSLRVHQKYFATRFTSGPQAGKIAPYFITVANRQSSEVNDALIKQGNERVLRARLADAAFFYAQDKAKPLSDFAPLLGHVTFYDGLGSVADKGERITALSAEIASTISGADEVLARQAAALAKADLVTDMVGEFPELQGIMGGYYAAHHGADEAVCEAISHHYRPAGPSDNLPAGPIGLAVSLADKIDTLVGFFGIGAKPTGSKDPFALRRAALAVLRMIDECDLSLPFEKICQSAAKAYGFDGVDPDLAEFVHDRLTVMLRDGGVAHDVVSATLSGAALEQPRLVMMKARQLDQILSGKAGADLMAGFKRANNILAAESKKSSSKLPTNIDEARLVETEEVALYQAVKAIPDITVETEADLQMLIASLGGLAAPINAFFEAIIVNDDDEAVRANRLALLHLIISQMGKVADFSKIER